MKRVLVSDSLSRQGIEILQAADGIQVDVKTGLKADELKAIIGGYDALVVRSSTKVTAELLEAAANLKVVGRAGIGVDNVDVTAATKRGVVVMNTPGGNTVTTAEHALALMMSLVRFVPQATMSMKAGEWEKKKFQGHELCGKSLGVVGLGNIGSIVADRALGLKMKVVAYDPFISPDRAAELGVELLPLDEVYRRADIITVHVPLLDETRGLVGADAFAKMKDGTYLVCAARGGIVDEKALLEAVESGKIAGAALDVFAQEPPGLTPLVSHERVICTPHLGASTVEAQEAVALQVAEQIVDYLVNGTIRNAVNVPSVPSEMLAQMRPYLEMARNLGRLQAQLGAAGLKSVELEYSGKTAEGRTGLYTAAALEGLLSASLGGRVNLVNAPVVARERGIRVVETSARSGEDYTALIRLRVET
ncbi:MAG: phosphoglycerate dehydrogenase, partial [Proteobacteria bacterium]|nr:phosphoglycerate dehydrogenase [Pseudomonadota bacterium]